MAVDLLTCSDCGKTWWRETAPGPKPKRCDDCNVAIKTKRARSATKTWQARNADGERAKARERSRTRRTEQPESVALSAKRVKIANRYGITLEQYEALHALGACFACGDRSPGTALGWHTDHDHQCCPPGKVACGKCVRGILCHRCNIMAGHFDREYGRAMAVLEYLQRRPRVSFERDSLADESEIA